MKRVNNLFEQIVDINNIIKAHFDARVNKAHYDDVKMVNEDIYKYAKEIQRLLINKEWSPSPVIKTERFASGKKRVTVDVDYFPDRIIHHAIMRVVEPVLSTTYIKDTYQSIKNRGLHKGVKRVKSWLKDEENTKYCLQVDIEKFYPSLQHSVIKKYIRKKIKCKGTLALMDKLIESDDNLPIGFYSSTSIANFVMSYVDHFIKSLGAKYYIRYADDIVIFHKCKKMLHFFRKQMQKFLKENLRLNLKGNFRVFPFDKGLDFLGYVFYRNYTLIRKRIATKMKRAFKKPIKQMRDISRLTSYLGWAKWANSYNLLRKLIPVVKSRVEILAKRLKIKNPLRKIYIIEKPKQQQLSFNF